MDATINQVKMISIFYSLDKYSQHKFLRTGDFNAEDSDLSLSQCLYEYHAHNIVKEKIDFFSICDQIRRKLRIWSHLLNNSLMENFIFCAVFKGLNNLTCTDLFLTSSPLCYENTMVISSALSDFHKMVIAVLKTKYKKNHSKEYTTGTTKVLTKSNLEQN